jgi:hypothetical protein
MAERFGVVLAIGLTFFGLIMILQQGVNLQLGLGGGSTPDRIVLASQNFGEIGGATSDIRTVSFGSFNIGEGRGTVRAYQTDSKDLENSLFSGNTVRVKYNGTQPTGANVSFEVLGKEGSGALYVRANGQKVFENQLVSTATETIEIPGQNLRNGMNTIEIGVNKGGILGSTEYALEDVEVNVNDRKFNDRVDNFQMFQYELKDFVGANLTFTIPADSSVSTAPLEVEVNDNPVFDRRTVRSTQNVEISRQQANLRAGYNTVEFKTDAEARYRLENTQLTVRYIGTTRPTTENMTFNLNQSRRDFVNRDNTEETLSFNYQMLSGVNTLDIVLGSFNTTLSPVNGENNLKIPEDAFREENTLSIQGQGSYSLNDVKIISERVEN